MLNMPDMLEDSVKTMSLTEYTEVIKSARVRRPIFKIELLRREDEAVIDSIEDDLSLASGGQLEISLNQGSRRSVSFEFANPDGKYTQFFNNLRLGTLFRLYLGLQDRRYGRILFPQGTFVFTDPTLSSDLSNRVISVSGVDKWALLDGTVGGNLQSTYTFPAKSKVSLIVGALLALDIIPYAIHYNIDPDYAEMEIPYAIEKKAGESVASILTEVAFAINCQIYFDEYGVLTLTPYPYDFAKQSVHSFIRGEDVNYISAQNQIMYSELYNGVYVVADNFQGTHAPIYAEMLNNDISDPNSVPNIGFTRYKSITDYTEGISTYSLALERCRYELKKVVAQQSDLEITCLPLYHLTANQCITVSDDTIGLHDQRYIIKSVSLPVNVSGTSTIHASRATDWL